MTHLWLCPRKLLEASRLIAMILYGTRSTTCERGHRKSLFELFLAPYVLRRRVYLTSTRSLRKRLQTLLASYAKDRLAAHVEAQESLQSFRTTLQDTANTLAQNNNGLPLVIVIDELDRCRPSYAVDLLEVAKHLFSVDHIVFVLAVNRSELAHSVCALYGNSFDGPDYLKRFFDLDFRLPNPSRREFIRAAAGRNSD